LTDQSEWELKRPDSRRLARLKPYKAARPEDTVSEIRARLMNLEMSFVEKAIHSEEGCFSYCLQLVDNSRGEPVFQTMGKGRTDAFARASAYGEMIERVQNLAFYIMLVYPSEPESKNLLHKAHFQYYPDEKYIAGEELHRSAARLFRNDTQPNGWAWEGPVIGVPFWDIFGARAEYIPYRAFQAVVGSNGMCSGNTMAEALIHGICEVFERYVLKQIFLSPFIPPDVPLDIFAGHDIYENMMRLAIGNGYGVQVKDCSLRLRLPVLGLLIRDGSGRYAFHLGSDPSPVTALERCFTEMCQSGSIIFMDSSGLEGVSGDVWDSEFWKTQLHLNIRSYEGHWPPEILNREPSRAFQGFEHPVSHSDDDDLEYLLRIIRDAGWEMFVRDNSFLGFPSYQVYIPGIGEMTNVLDNAFVWRHLGFDRFLHVLANPAGATQAQRRELLGAMTEYETVAPSRLFRAADWFLYYPGHPLAAMSQADFRDFLAQPALTEFAVPSCFECSDCRHLDRCSYDFISKIWNRLKQVMKPGAWTRNNAGQTEVDEMDNAQPVPAGENCS
jgi:ribosomal protein S12 methylthiotransferase accessory factor